MIKGRRLTNKESEQMLDNEILQAKERCCKLAKELDNIQIFGVNTTLLNNSYKLYLSRKESDFKYENRL